MTSRAGYFEQGSSDEMGLGDFPTLPAGRRRENLLAAIRAQHAYHFERNTAYRQALVARGVKTAECPENLALLLRPASLTFKSYADRIGPFPQDHPLEFLRWLEEQLSIALPPDRRSAFRARYSTLEALLRDIERIYADLGLEVVTSTGTSGRASMVVRDAATIALAVSAFFSGIRDAWGIQRGTALIFVMPAETRVAMARTARFGTRQLGWADDGNVYFTVPFSATPDQLRIRAGRTFRSGLTGQFERRVAHPFMNWANAHLAEPRFIALTLQRLRECVEAGQRLMLLGGLVQLHAVGRAWAEQSALKTELPPGSRVATGGGIKEAYPFSAGQIRSDLAAAFGGVPVSDVYGMAEANWAAFECPAGNHHIPTWVHAVVTDDDDKIVDEPVATGLLAFFDPIGGGRLIPPFFQTADRVELVNPAAGQRPGREEADPALYCPCGYDGSYLRGDIKRVDLVEEAGCAAQV